jgi:hypothetical protein
MDEGVFCGRHCDTLKLPLQDVLDTWVCFICLFFIFGGRLQGQRADTRRQGDEWDWGVGHETHKESVQSLKTKTSKQKNPKLET